MSETYPPGLSIEDIKVKIQNTFSNPNIGKTHQVVLKNGPRAYRVATIFEIMDPEKTKLHHLSLQLDSFDKTKKHWREKPEKRINLEGRDPNEIKMLSEFLNVALSEHYPDEAGEYHVIIDDQFTLIQKLIDLLPRLSGDEKIQLIKQVLQSVSSIDIDPIKYLELFETTTNETIKYIGLAALFVRYKNAFYELKELIDNEEPSENKYQNHLTSYPWIFGSEYSEIIDRRTWTRDDNLDFMLRRTTDNYLEIVEIKTPSVGSLFNYDSSHDSYYASSKLSQVIGQVFRYIEEVERSRDHIIVKDSLDPLKIRARVIIGISSRI